MAISSQNAIKPGFFVTSGRNSGQIESESHRKLCKAKPIYRTGNFMQNQYLQWIMAFLPLWDGGKTKPIFERLVVYCFGLCASMARPQSRARLAGADSVQSDWLIAAAVWRPLLIACTTSEAPLMVSPAANTHGWLV